MMARSPTYRVPFRRRREGKTNYKLRRSLVLSKLPRLVVRKTLKHIIVQVSEAKIPGDETIVSTHSRELTKKYGWQGNYNNIPAAYLTGLLCGYKAKVKGVEKAIIDIGLQLPSRGARVFASLKGVLDAGVIVPHNERVLPHESRIRGQHIVEYANWLLSNTEVYQQRFSRYLSRKLPPEKITEHFSRIKEKIVSSFEEEET